MPDSPNIEGDKRRGQNNFVLCVIIHYPSTLWECGITFHCNVTLNLASVCTVHDSCAKNGRKERCLGLGMERQGNGEVEE